MLYYFIYKSSDDSNLDQSIIKTIEADDLQAAIRLYVLSDTLDQHLISNIINEAQGDEYLDDIEDEVNEIIDNIGDIRHIMYMTYDGYIDFIHGNFEQICELLSYLSRGNDYFLASKVDEIIAENLTKSASKR